MKKPLAVSILIMFSISIAGLTARIVAQEKKPGKVTLELKDTPAEEAMKQLLKTNNASYSIADSARDALKDAKVTASFKDVDFDEAVQMLASALELSATKRGEGYSLDGSAASNKQIILKSRAARGQSESGSATIKVVRGGRENVDVRAFTYALKDRVVAVPRVLRSSPLLALPKTEVDVEPYLNMRSRLFGETIVCAHCQQSATIRSESGQDSHRCTKCQRNLRSEYKFCPYDGTELPASSVSARYCPFCGKHLEKK